MTLSHIKMDKLTSSLISVLPDSRAGLSLELPCSFAGVTVVKIFIMYYECAIKRLSLFARLASIGC